jgi:hypothetical protein
MFFMVSLFFQANARTVSQDTPRTLPSKSLPIYCSLIILPSNATGFHIGEGPYCGLQGYDNV